MEQKWVEKRNQQTVFDAVESGSVAETDAVGAGDLCLLLPAAAKQQSSSYLTTVAGEL